MSKNKANTARVLRNTGLNIGCLNIRSLVHKVDQLSVILNDENLDILFINESWLNENISTSEICIPGYSCFRYDRPAQRGGGVAVYIKDTVNAICRSDINERHPDIEMIWLEVEVKSKECKTVLTGTIYRPPSSSFEYMNNVIDALDALSTEGLEMILLGDLNFNYLANSTKDSITMLERAYTMTQLIKSPTRTALVKDPETNQLCLTTSLIDVILSTCPDVHTFATVKPCSLSDHDLIKTQIAFLVLRRHRTITYRHYSRFSKDQFRSDIMDSVIFTNVTKMHHTQNAWKQFKAEFDEISTKHAPMRTSRMKIRNKPWVTQDVVKEIYKRNHLYNQAKINKDEISMKVYKQQRNKVTSMIRHNKRMYFEHAINSGKNTIWELVNQVCPRRQQSQIKSNITANDFGLHFSQTGRKISQSFPSIVTDETSIKGPKCIHKFELSPVSSESVMQVINALPNKSSNDIIGMDSYLLKIAGDLIIESITHIINLSISQNVFLPEWKIARVTPAYKGQGSYNDMSSYRPISNICHMGKIIEKAVNAQLVDYLSSNKFITPDQSAYLSGNSTQTSLHRVTDDWLENYNQGAVTMACFLDIKKCYDSIDNGIMINKLKRYGVLGHSLKWFQQYLTNRSMIIKYNNESSETYHLDIGLPQGSVLGPTLFNIFINDLSQAISNGQLNMYADDALIYVIGDTVSAAKAKLQIAINEASLWYAKNHLKLNEQKCHCMIICKDISPQDQPEPILLNGEPLEYVSVTKYLGIYIDNKLNFKLHCEKSAAKVRSKLAALRRMSQFLPQTMLTKMYKSKIEPGSDYGLTIWGYSSAQNKNTMQRLQNMAARIVTNNFDFENTRGLDLVKQLRWTEFETRLKYHVSLLMFKATRGLAPDYINDLILFAFELHDYRTRNTLDMNLVLPMVYKDKFRQSLQYAGAKVWNELSDEVRNASTLGIFKSGFKRRYF